LVLRLVETGMPSGVAGVDVMEIGRPDGAGNIADLGVEAVRGEAAFGALAASDCRHASGRSCGSAARVSVLYWAVSRQRAAMPFARDTVRRGDGTAAAVSLRQLRSQRALCHLVIALSIDA
jgi:hypothetical protein